MRMRLLTLVAAVGLGAALAQSASAADLSMPPIYRGPPPAYFTWTGWYVGLNGGGGWGQTNHTATVNAAGLPPVTTNRAPNCRCLSLHRTFSWPHLRCRSSPPRDPLAE